MPQPSLRTIYKGILKLHRALPKDLKELGDGYTKDEFRRHIKSSTEDQLKIFIKEWTEYHTTLAQQLGVTDKLVPSNELQATKPGVGKSLPLEKLDEFQDSQLYQLYELKLATNSKPQQAPSDAAEPNAQKPS